jgi:hypothetical protein
MSGFWYRGACPVCGKSGRWLSQHSTAVWCHSCGWARNRFPDPATGRPVAKWGLLGDSAFNFDLEGVPGE